jgi:hypothetical protein
MQLAGRAARRCNYKKTSDLYNKMLLQPGWKLW